MAINGINSWRREAEWKKKYELAEEVLSCFYEISERFDIIRNPAGHVGEGQTRKRSENESPAESEVLGNAYVIIERYEKEKAPFTKLKSLKYRFMVLYGKEAGEPFDDIAKMTDRLFLASRKLGRKYWKDQGRRKFSEEQFQKHLKEMEKQEAIFCANVGNKDEFKDSINQIIVKIEAICREIIEKR